MPRLRIVAYHVQLQAMSDDGDELTPLQLQPLTVAAADWPDVLTLVGRAVEPLREQVEGPPPQAL